MDCFVAALLAMTGFVSGNYYVYIVTNRPQGTLYVGVTSDLKRRVWQHKNKALPGFTSEYDLGRLIYFEAFRDIRNAIGREKQLKAGCRAEKIALIERENLQWDDLSLGWF